MTTEFTVVARATDATTVTMWPDTTTVVASGTAGPRGPAGDGAGDLAAHNADTTGVHGIADTSALYRAGGTDVAIADGGTGASDAATARSNLGLGTAATTAATDYATAAQGAKADTAVQPARTISTTAPLSGGGDLTANRTLSVSNATVSAVGVVQLATPAATITGTSATTAVTPAGAAGAYTPLTRTISTTAPLSGGGDLTANRTLSVSAASDTASGVVELATSAETITGTDTARAVTPAAAAAAYVPKSLVDAKGDLIVGTADGTVARLAVSGNDGYVLTEDSTQPGGMKFAAASGGGGSLPAQAPLTFNDSSTPYVGAPGVALRARGGAVSIPANEYRAFMIVVFAPITITEARINVESAGTAGTNSRIAIYEQDTADGKLGALVADLGTVSIASTGQKRLTGLSTSLASGVYLVRAHNQSTASLTYFEGHCPWWSSAPLGNNNNPLALQSAGVTYGAAEDPGTKASTEFGDVTGAAMFVLVQFAWTVN